MRKRTEKFRGSRTHGRGKKAGRGAGKRGGRGNAGLHKHKFMTTVKYDPDHFGRSGFKRHRSLITQKTLINIGKVKELIEKGNVEGSAKKAGDMIEVNLSELKIDKLLGGGNIKSPMKIIVDEATDRAIEKVKGVGGRVILATNEAPISVEESDEGETEDTKDIEQ